MINPLEGDCLQMMRTLDAGSFDLVVTSPPCNLGIACRSFDDTAPRAGESVSAGHFKSINSKRFVNDCHKYVFHLTKSGAVQLDRRGAGVPYQDKSTRLLDPFLGIGPSAVAAPVKLRR